MSPFMKLVGEYDRSHGKKKRERNPNGQTIGNKIIYSHNRQYHQTSVSVCFEKIVFRNVGWIGMMHTKGLDESGAEISGILVSEIIA